MSRRPLRFGLVGAGGISEAYVRAFATSDEASLVGVADVRVAAAAALAERAHCLSFRNHLDLLEEGGCDAIVISTPPVTHPEIAIAALDRGISVLCEKPLSIDLESTHRMIAAAEASDGILTMASKFRYVEDVIRAKSLVASGVLGEIILFENTFTTRVDMSGRWNCDPLISGGGVLIDNGTHSIDLVRYFLGQITEVHAIEGRNVQQLGVEDTVTVFVRCAGGATGSIDLSWSVDKELSSYVSLYGTRGTVSVGWKESRYRRLGDTAWEVIGGGYDKIEAFRRQIDNFSRAHRGEEALAITVEDALASVQVVERAYESLRTDHWIPVGSRVPSEAGNASGIRGLSALSS